MVGVLDGVRVLDLSRILAGPWSTQILADFGAEVIKIEKPNQGDDTRSWGPPFIENNNCKESAYFLSANRGKKSLTLDFTKDEGRDIIYKLVKSCDIFVENFKYGGLKKYGLDYDKISSINPKIIYCSITGFGQTGPLKARAGYDFMIQAMGGLMSVTGNASGDNNIEPQKTGIPVADLFTGLYCSNAIIAALFNCEKTGIGQYIDISLLDSQLAVLANQAMNALVSGKAPKSMGNAHPNIVPYQVFNVADGHLIVAVGNDGQFVKFCKIIGCAELSSDQLFVTNADRVKNRNILIPLLAVKMLEKTKDQWIDLFEKSAVPCGVINDIKQAFENQQVKSRKMQLELPHQSLGTVPSVASPVNFSNNPIEYKTAPPILGQHNEHILKNILNLNDLEINNLTKNNII